MIRNRLFEIFRNIRSSETLMHHFDSRLLKIRNQQSQISNGHQHSGDNNAVAPPVPIPNTEVKRCSPDGSTAIGRARVGRRQNRAPAGHTICGCFVLASPTRAENTPCWEAGEWTVKLARVAREQREFCESINRTSPKFDSRGSSCFSLQVRYNGAMADDVTPAPPHSAPPVPQPAPRTAPAAIW